MESVNTRDKTSDIRTFNPTNKSQIAVMQKLRVL